MKIGILSDIHANIQALEFVLAHLADQQVDAIWFLGDAVGRGPNPVEVLDWLSTHVELNHWVMGNHDLMLGDLMTPDKLMKPEDWKRVNELAKITLSKHKVIIQHAPKEYAFIVQHFTRAKIHPQEWVVDNVCYMLVHGGLIDNAGINRYVYPWTKVFIRNEVDALKEKCAAISDASGVLLFGHTHIPTLVSASFNGDAVDIHIEKVFPEQTYHLSSENYWLINPGSVGQPRDLDNRAAYAFLDTAEHTITFHRIEYDLPTTAQQLALNEYDEQLPEILMEASPPPDVPEEWLAHFIRTKEVVNDLS